MMTSTLPVDGWVDRCGSYGFTIVRSVVTQLRDGGPLDTDRVRSIIKRAGVGSDVAKASPFFDEDDGADRILTLLVQDIPEIVCVDGVYSVDPNIQSVTSRQKGFTVQFTSVEEAAQTAADQYRVTHLRRWTTSRPFQNVWRDGLRDHTDEEIGQMAEYIQAIGYVGNPIVRDQNGLLIDGHLRAAAMEKLSMDPSPHTIKVHFVSDYHRLGWILAAHYIDGRWPTAIRDTVKRVVNHSMVRSGVKMEWPQDVAFITPISASVPTVPAPPSTPVIPITTILSRPVPLAGTSLTYGSQTYKCIAWLNENPGHTARESLRAIGMSTAGGGASISRWKELGLIVEGQRKGRNGVPLYLTEAGKQVLANATPRPLPPPSWS